jgi:hypothetical protein
LIGLIRGNGAELKGLTVAEAVDHLVKAYPEYADKIIGAGGIVRNRTIFPIKVKKITPIGSSHYRYSVLSIIF